MSAPTASFSQLFYGLNDAEIRQCSVFGLKYILLSSLFLIVFCCIFGSLSSLFSSSYPESFGGAYSFPSQYFPNWDVREYNSLEADLNSPSDPQDLQVAKVTRIFDAQSKIPQFVYDIRANLWVLNGNPFGEINTTDLTFLTQYYNVFLEKAGEAGKSDPSVPVKDLGKMTVNSDGIYKLHFTTQDLKGFSIYDIVTIHYVNASGEHSEILRGSFKLGA